MNDISCDVCCDLIPLVLDDAASPDSRSLVAQHVKQCESCRVLMGELKPGGAEMDEKKIVRKIKKGMFLVCLAIVVAGASLGVAFSNSADAFYNIVIMPLLGVLCYALARKKALLLPPAVFVLGMVTLTIRDCLSDALYWSVIYAALCTVGVLIGALLHYAFKKEKV